MPPSIRAGVVCLLLALAVTLVFVQTARHDFLRRYDDDNYVYNNPRVTEPVSPSSLYWAMTAFHASNWHPLTWLSHMLDWQLYGPNPAGHHLTNVVLHAFVAMLLLAALHRMTGMFWPSAFTTAVFAIHPLRVESVAWISERKDLLSGMFFMLAVFVYLGYLRRRSLRGFIAVVLLHALGLLCKPMLVTLPIVLWLVGNWWPVAGGPSSVAGASGPRNLKSQISNSESSLHRPPFALLLTLCLLSAASCIVTLVAQAGAMPMGNRAPVFDRCGNAAVACCAYLGQWLWPTQLAVYYPLPHDGWPAWRVALSLLILAAITATVVSLRRRCPVLLFGWLWYLVILLPVLGLVQVGLQSHADRYTYLALIGPTLAVATLNRGIGFQPMSAKHHGQYARATIISAFLLAALAARAWQQTSLWHDSTTLFQHTVACGDDCGAVEATLGLLSEDAHNWPRAIEHFVRSVQYEPGAKFTHSLLAVALDHEGRSQEALGHVRIVVNMLPPDINDRIELGFMLARCGEYDEARSELEAVLATDPASITASNHLAKILMLQKKKPQALALLQRTAAAVDSDNPHAQIDLAAAYADIGEYPTAVQYAQRALALAAGNPALAAEINQRLERYRARKP